MKHFIKYTFTFITMLCLSSCYDKDFDSQVIYNSHTQNITFTADESSKDVFIFVSESRIDARKGDPNNTWYNITFNSTSSTFSNLSHEYDRLSIQTYNNTTEDSRKDTIYLQSNSGLSSYFEIRQNGLKATVSLSDLTNDTLYFTEGQNSNTFSFITNFPWTISPNDTAIVISNADIQGEKNKKDTITVQLTSTPIYPASITITSGREVSKQVYIFRKNAYYSSLKEYYDKQFSICDLTNAELHSMEPYGDNGLIYKISYTPSSENVSFSIQKEDKYLSSKLFKADTCFTMSDNTINLSKATVNQRDSIYLIKCDSNRYTLSKDRNPFSVQPYIIGSTSLNVKKENLSFAKMECKLLCSDSELAGDVNSIKWQVAKINGDGTAGTWENIKEGGYTGCTIVNLLDDTAYNTAYYRCIVGRSDDSVRYTSNILKTSILE